MILVLNIISWCTDVSLYLKDGAVDRIQKLKTASVIDGYCTRFNGNSQIHLDAVTA